MSERKQSLVTAATARAELEEILSGRAFTSSLSKDVRARSLELRARAFSESCSR
jgi:hypothetical protein